MNQLKKELLKDPRRHKTTTYVCSFVVERIVRLKGLCVEAFAFTSADLRLVADLHRPIGFGMLVEVLDAFS